MSSKVTKLGSVCLSRSIFLSMLLFIRATSYGTLVYVCMCCVSRYLRCGDLRLPGVMKQCNTPLGRCDDDDDDDDVPWLF